MTPEGRCRRLEDALHALAEYLEACGWVLMPEMSDTWIDPLTNFRHRTDIAFVIQMARRDPAGQGSGQSPEG